MARQTDREVVNEAPNNRFSTLTVGHGWLYGLLAIIILLLVFLAGMGIASNHRHSMAGGYFGPHRTRGEFGTRFGAGRTGNSLEGAVTNGQTRTGGVVTSVNGNSFTIAGHGSTASVTTNSSTQYQNGNQVKQNDSVIVFGTGNNGTITASRIVINP